MAGTLTTVSRPTKRIPKRPERRQAAPERGTLMLALRVYSGAEAGKLFIAWCPGVYRIGRNDGTDFQISDGAVSREHLVVRIDAKWGITVQDVGSSGGTSVNDLTPLERETKIQSGDMLILAELVHVGVFMLPRREFQFLSNDQDLSRPVARALTQHLKRLSVSPPDEMLGMVAIGTQRAALDTTEILFRLREGDVQDGRLAAIRFSLVPYIDLVQGRGIANRIGDCAKLIVDADMRFKSEQGLCVVVVLLLDARSAAKGEEAALKRLKELVSGAERPSSGESVVTRVEKL